jgi:FixJ family two-component response regulator
MTPATTAPGSSAATPIVHLVEDDESARASTARFLRAAGYVVQTYVAASDFLAREPSDAAGCVILDLCLPDVSGLELQRLLAGDEDPLPVIFLTGEGQVHDSVQAMKSGAVDFLLKTEDGAVLLNAVAQALARNLAERAVRARRRESRIRYDTLTARERDVFAYLISGHLNKQIGFALGIRETTIKIHRRRVLEKMGADSLTQLARMADDLEIAPAPKVT